MIQRLLPLAVLLLSACSDEAELSLSVPLEIPEQPLSQVADVVLLEELAESVLLSAIPAAEILTKGTGGRGRGGNQGTQDGSYRYRSSMNYGARLQVNGGDLKDLQTTIFDAYKAWIERQGAEVVLSSGNSGRTVRSRSLCYETDHQSGQLSVTLAPDVEDDVFKLIVTNYEVWVGHRPGVELD